MRAVSFLALTGLAVVAGCGDDSRRIAVSEMPPVTVPAARTVSAPVPAGSSVKLSRTYEFDNRRRRVISTLTVGPSGKVRDPSIVIPAGRRPYRVSVRIDDRGPAGFPYEWARFTLANRQGARVDNYVRTAVRRLLPNRRRSPRQTFLTFLIPAGFSPSEVRVSSIVRIWPFRARWRLDA